MSRTRAINKTQGLVLGFFAVAWVALVALLAVSADVRDVTVRRMPGAGPPAVIAFVVALLVFLTVVGIGALRRWRWVFWLILVAFAAGLVRVPVAVLQLTGRMAPEGPDWYVVVQGVIGAIQVAIAVAMLIGYRRSGPWGPSERRTRPEHANAHPRTSASAAIRAVGASVADRRGRHRWRPCGSCMGTPRARSAAWTVPVSTLCTGWRSGPGMIHAGRGVRRGRSGRGGVGDGASLHLVGAGAATR